MQHKQDLKVFGVTYDKTKKILVYKDTLGSKKLKEVSILKVFKDKDFGGGGSGGGADLTRIAESANVIIVLMLLMLQVEN